MSLKFEHALLQDPAFSAAEFHERLRLSSPEQLEQCIRLLGMYLALYKRQFGELEESAYAGLLGFDPADMNLAELMAEGLQESSAMLMMIHAEPDAPLPAGSESARIN